MAEDAAAAPEVDRVNGRGHRRKLRFHARDGGTANRPYTGAYIRTDTYPHKLTPTNTHTHTHTLSLSPLSVP